MTSIEFVKQNIQNRASLLLMKGDPQAQRVLVAWTFYGAPRPASLATSLSSSPPPRASATEVLAALWKAHGPVNMPALAADANVPATRCAKILQRLQNAGLIWPDGTISTVADKILTAEQNAYIADVNTRQKRML